MVSNISQLYYIEDNTKKTISNTWALPVSGHSPIPLFVDVEFVGDKPTRCFILITRDGETTPFLKYALIPWQDITVLRRSFFIDLKFLKRQLDSFDDVEQDAETLERLDFMSKDFSLQVVCGTELNEISKISLHHSTTQIGQTLSNYTAYNEKEDEIILGAEGEDVYLYFQIYNEDDIIEVAQI